MAETSKRKAKMIEKKEDIEFFTSLKEKDITSSFVMNTFGEFDGKAKFHPYDLIEIPAGVYGPSNKKNKKPFITGVGSWVFNIFFIQDELFDLFHYISKPINKKMLGNIDTKLSYAVLEDKIPLQALKNFENKVQICMPFTDILSPNYTEKMLNTNKLVEGKKQELIKKYADDIKAGNEVAASAMEKELMDYAREILKDDPSLDMFDSGARGSFDNNFKNMFLMKGATKHPDPSKGYEILTSSYMGGISKEEYASFANALIEGPYFRANKTQVGGYWEKLFMSAFQHLKLLPAGSDCGTSRYITYKVTEKNISDIMYCYVIEGSKLTEITSDNMDKFIGKTVKLRFSSMCESKSGYICNKCAGNLFYRIGVENIGSATPQIPSKLKLLSLKQFHNSQIKVIDMDVMKAFGIDK